MSEKSGVSDQVLSLPEGGGAVSSIGEKFSPDLFTGTGNYSVPIEVPSRRNDLQPSLSLTYNSGSGNGLFGMGWSPGVKSIARKTSEGLPTYDDEDTFLLGQGEDLVPIETPAGVQRYRPRSEGTFAPIDRHVDSDTDHWVMEEKSGMTYVFGTPKARGDDPATVSDPDDPLPPTVRHGIRPARPCSRRRWSLAVQCSRRHHQVRTDDPLRRGANARLAGLNLPRMLPMHDSPHARPGVGTVRSLRLRNDQMEPGSEAAWWIEGVAER